jgi:hypothetical protein
MKLNLRKMLTFESTLESQNLQATTDVEDHQMIDMVVPDITAVVMEEAVEVEEDKGITAAAVEEEEEGNTVVAAAEYKGMRALVEEEEDNRISAAVAEDKDTTVVEEEGTTGVVVEGETTVSRHVGWSTFLHPPFALD